MPEMALMALMLSGIVNPLRKRLEAGVLVFRLSWNPEGRFDLCHFSALASGRTFLAPSCVDGGAPFCCKRANTRHHPLIRP